MLICKLLKIQKSVFLGNLVVFLAFLLEFEELYVPLVFTIQSNRFWRYLKSKVLLNKYFLIIKSRKMNFDFFIFSNRTLSASITITQNGILSITVYCFCIFQIISLRDAKVMSFKELRNYVNLMGIMPQGFVGKPDMLKVIHRLNSDMQVMFISDFIIQFCVQIPECVVIRYIWCKGSPSLKCITPQRSSCKKCLKEDIRKSKRGYWMH